MQINKTKFLYKLHYNQNLTKNHLKNEIQLNIYYIITITMSLIKEFEPLFNIKSNGRLYRWKIWVERDSDDKVMIMSEHGQDEGKQVLHSREVPAGKAKRTVEEQAISEAKSKWTKKMEKENYVTTKLQAKEHEKNQTSDVGRIRPMLAKTYGKEKGKSKIAEYPVYVQRKYDGVRCLAYIDENSDIKFMTRQGKEILHLTHIRDVISNIFTELDTPDRFVFDGELYSHDDMCFEDMAGLIRKKKPSRDEMIRTHSIHYEVYDVIMLDNLNEIYETRREWLINIFSVIQEDDRKVSADDDESEEMVMDGTQNNPVMLSESFLVETEEEVDACHEKFVEEGFEGLIIRTVEGKYGIDKRSKDLLKYKTFLEEEFEIIGYNEGQGSDAGTVVWVAKTKDGGEFSVRPMGTHESRAKLLDDAESHIGKQLTVKFFEYTRDGIPRFPQGKCIRDGY
jgi:DNA ligase 1